MPQTKKMADEVECDDQWLYGDNSDITPHESAPVVLDNDTTAPEVSKDEADSRNNVSEEGPASNEGATENTENKDKANETNHVEKQNGEGSDKEDYEEDSDDDVNVVIGDIKTSPAYTSLNIKRGGLLTTTSKGDKVQQPPQSGKFTVEEFDQAGTINGVPVGDFNLDSLEDKPWRKPGADITDYFNYGFNEDTWRAYCERQKRMRVSESGTGLLPLNAIGMPRGPVPIMNDNSKYSGSYAGLRKAGPPPGRRMAGSIDVIGGATTRIGGPIGKIEPPKENVIQVMTADRREYSRKQPGFPDMSVPPPSNTFEEFHPEYDFNPEPEPFYGGYEPTQDSQWGTGANPSWQPQEIKTLTPAPAGPMVAPVPAPAPIPPVNMPLAVGPVAVVSMPAPSPVQEDSPNHRSRSKDRDRESSRRETEKPRDRERERSHRRERSRSRSRRHKSRSRSPSHRSHRKKKSRRHEDSE